MSPELVATAFFYAFVGALVMYISARNSRTRGYETRRSICLLEHARVEAANNRSRGPAKGPRNKTVIYLSDEWESLWWSDRLGISPRALRVAVHEVGPMAADVQRYLRRGQRGRYALARKRTVGKVAALS